jgi:hypothetical protein
MVIYRLGELAVRPDVQDAAGVYPGVICGAAVKQFAACTYFRAGDDATVEQEAAIQDGLP